MGAVLAGETAAINNWVIIKSRAKGARDRSFGKGALFPTNGNESGNVQGPRTMRCTPRENQREKDRERERNRTARVPRNPSPDIKCCGEQAVRKIVNETCGPWNQWLNSPLPQPIGSESNDAGILVLAVFLVTFIARAKDLGRSRSLVPTTRTTGNDRQFYDLVRSFPACY